MEVGNDYHSADLVHPFNGAHCADDDEEYENPSTDQQNIDKRRMHICSECSANFANRMELEEHVNSHTGRKPFVCDVCEACFNRRSTLWNHKRIHSDHKPFKCPVCSTEFKWKNSLKCHREMHLRKNDAGSDRFDAQEVRNMSFTRKRSRLNQKSSLVVNELEAINHNSVSDSLHSAESPKSPRLPTDVNCISLPKARLSPEIVYRQPYPSVVGTDLDYLRSSADEEHVFSDFEPPLASTFTPVVDGLFVKILPFEKW